MGLFDGTALERPVTCAHCDKTIDDCDCPRSASGEIVQPEDQSPRVRREKRRGKWTTVVTGLDPVATDLATYVKTLKTTLGVGGTVTDDGFELQGDHRDRVVDHLKEDGFQAKPSGG
ncbi:MAG: translation initiation factor [Planctomycetota bacterium]